jgi:hypothetical protein
MEKELTKRHNSFISMRAKLGKSRLQFLQLGKKFTTQLCRDLEVKEEALKELEAVIQETKKAPFVATVEANAMTTSSMVNSPSKTLSQETFDDFENHSRGIDSKFMKQMGYDGQGIGKEGQGIQIPIVAQWRPNHEGLGFGGQEANTS